MNKTKQQWHPATTIPQTTGKFIEEILIEYENDIGTFHAIGLFAIEKDGTPLFLEVMTGTKILWAKTVKKWTFFND